MPLHCEKVGKIVNASPFTERNAPEVRKLWDLYLAAADQHMSMLTKHIRTAHDTVGIWEDGS